MGVHTQHTQISLGHTNNLKAAGESFRTGDSSFILCECTRREEARVLVGDGETSFLRAMVARMFSAEARIKRSL